MAQNFVSKYLSASFDKDYVPSERKGLIVTISRQKGCGAFPIAKEIMQRLNRLRYPLGRVVKWKLISKEILEESAKKLELAPGKVETIMDRQQKNLFDEILLSFSEKSLPNDLKIKNTIRNVIKNAADEGNVIIIGRGGACITRNYKNSLHIRLIAPLEWRSKVIAEQEKISLEKARKLIIERDQQREALKQFFLGDVKPDIGLFDMVINVSTLNGAEIAEAIFQIIKNRQDQLMKRH